MATLIWTSVFILLVIELFITLLLVLPLPRIIRRFLATKIFTYGLAERVRFGARFVFIGMLFAFFDAITTMRYLIVKEEVDTGNATTEGTPVSYINTSLNKQLKFRAERNMYLAGFALTLMFVITRLIELMQELVKLEEEKDKLANRSVAGGLPSSDASTTTTTTTTTMQKTSPIVNISADGASSPTTIRKRPAAKTTGLANAKSD